MPALRNRTLSSRSRHPSHHSVFPGRGIAIIGLRGRILKRPPTPGGIPVERRNRRVPPVTLRDDRALVEALCAGDPLAPAELVERFHGVVFGLCYRMMGHRHDAEDVAQEALVRRPPGRRAGSTARGRCGPGSSGSPRIAAGPALGRRSRRPDDRRGPRGAGRPPARPVRPDDLAGELDRALDRLRPEYRLVFALYHEQALPYEEIAPDDRPTRRHRQDLAPSGAGTGRIPAARDHLCGRRQKRKESEADGLTGGCETNSVR